MAPCQVDDFAEGCERSKKGALYFRPSSTMDLTSDEYKHLMSKHKRLGKSLRVVQYRHGEDYDVNKSILGKKAAAEAKKAPEAKKTAKDNPTKAQRKAAAKDKAKDDPAPKATPPPPAPEPAMSAPSGKSKDKDKGRK